MKKLAISIIMFCSIAFLTMPSSLYANDAQQLLSPAELKGWIDNGYIDNWGRKVVILDTGIDLTNPPFFDNRATYDAGHIPGAYYVSPFELLNVVRTDGPIFISPLVVFDGTRMDDFIQQYGIERDTAVVFTGNTMWMTTRVYWTLRYWGFKKSQLFILNGKANGDQSVWKDAGYELETEEPPPPVPSTFSVSECPGNMDAVRASTEEFFMAADGAIPNSVVVDARPVADYNADIDTLSEFNKNDIFAFQVKNSIWIEWSEFLVGGESGKHVFKSEQDIVAMLQAKGITESMVPYSFSQIGGTATVNFFVFEAMLDRAAKIHDGSSVELGKLGTLGDACSVSDKHCDTDTDCPAGETCEDIGRCSLNGILCRTDSNCPAGETCEDIGLPFDSPWRFDLVDYCSIINYNYPSLALQPPIANAYAASANLVNEEDKAYYDPLPDLPVDVDIKPGSCPNPMGLKCNGVLPVAVLGTEEFNVMDIDPETIMLTREGGFPSVTPISYSYEDVATPFEGDPCDCHTKRKDGLMDLTLKFKASELIDGLNLNEVPEGENVPLILKGLTNDCTPIRGEDCILWLAAIPVDVDIKPGSCPNPLNLKSKGVLPVAILGNDCLDVTTIDPASILLQGVAPLRWANADVGASFEPYTGKKDCFEDCEDCSCPDDYMDLLLNFDRQEIVAALGKVYDGDCLVLTLTGKLQEEYNGTPIVGEDVLLILKKGK